VVVGDVADVSQLYSASISMVEVCKLGKWNNYICLALVKRNSGQTALLRTQKLTNPHTWILINEAACIFEMSATDHPRTE
jgi:hypothetical protein